jgi:hypothetical protein
MILQDNIMQFYDIFMTSVVDLAQVTERSYLTAEQVAGNFIIDRS